MNENSNKWVTEQNSKGEIVMWMPYTEYIARQFIGKMFDKTYAFPKLWGRQPITDREEVWKIAQKEYENFKEELPASYLAHYLP